MLVSGLQSESLSKMTSGSKVDYSYVYEALYECAQEMLDKYNQKQVHTGKLGVKIRAVNILLHELKKLSEKSVTTRETVLSALKSHAEELQGHEHLLSKKGNTYALLEQTRALRERHGEAPASLLRYHDLKDNLLEAGIPRNPELKEAMSTWAENKTLTLQTLVALDEESRTEGIRKAIYVYCNKNFPVQDSLNSRLLGNIKCFICKNIMSQPREICPQNHLTCLECSKVLAGHQVTNCPDCRSTLLAEFKQNIPVERLIGNLQVRCCNSTLLNSIECCICKQIMNQPREICPESHLTCLECSRALKKRQMNCPMCRGTLLEDFKRNIPIERFIGNLQVRCHNAGCSSSIEISGIKSHLTLCGEEKVECPRNCTDESTGKVLRIPRKRLAEHGKECSGYFECDRFPDDQIDNKVKRSRLSVQNRPEEIPAAQEIGLEYQAPEYAIDVTAELKALEDALGLNGKESETVHRLFSILKSKKIRLEEDFHTLLCRHMERKCLLLFCMKASLFFRALTDNVKHTSCLTDMLNNKKEHIQDFITRKDSELEYLAGLDTFHYFSLMNHGMGLPKKEMVKACLVWRIWKPDGVFSMELFRAFSSMNHGRGLPGKEAVEALMNWKVWKPDGVFSMDLFLAFAFMNHGRGLPRREEAVKEMLSWDVWKQEGAFSMELFLAFAFMNHGKGLPGKEAVEALLDWEVWKPGGVFSIELFRVFSSMYHGNGLPGRKEAVEEMLSWDVWKQEGAFNMELFRVFSFMCHGKGLPRRKETVEEMLSWDVWKQEGAFSMELFRIFSFMNCGKGLPRRKEAVKEMLSWNVWKQEGAFNMELFRIFSSMYHGKGLPGRKEAVEEMLGWDVWKQEGAFNMELFHAVSSMNSGKGLPKKKMVETLLGWEVWRPEGVFSLALFCTFASMNHGKGLPKKETVKALLGWEIWKPEGVFSIELFRAFSFMNHGGCLPRKEVVEAVLDWDVWNLEGVFSMELFFAFAFMNHGRGLPGKEAVETMLNWDVWNLEGVFSMELFFAFASINHGKGLPREEAVKAVLDWDVWKLDGVFSLALFRTFLSINHGKSLPVKEVVEAVLDWDVWRPEGTFSLKLFRLFAAMNHGKGLPGKEAVEAVLSWDVWKLEGTFSLELFRAFSFMNYGKGLPRKEAVETVLDWDIWRPEGVFSLTLFRNFASMNCGKGLPGRKEVVEEVMSQMPVAMEEV